MWWCDWRQGEGWGGCSCAKWSQMAHGLSFSCWHHAWAECTEQEVTRPGAARQCCLWQRESILHKTCVMESPALSDKPLPFPSMQGTPECRHTIQWWEVCWCHYEATGGIWSQICRLQDAQSHFSNFCGSLLLWCARCPSCASNGAHWPAVQLCPQSQVQGGEWKRRQAWAIFARIEPQLPWAFPNVQADHVPFWEHIFVWESMFRRTVHVLQYSIHVQKNPLKLNNC